MSTRRAPRAFTLLEVILAIAVGSVVLCSASYYLYSLTLLYSEVVRSPRFDEHADTVALVLADAFNTASMGQTSRNSRASADSNTSTVTWLEASFLPNSQPVLSFKTSVDLGIGGTPGTPTPPQRVSLLLDEKLGLILGFQRQSDLQNYPDRVQFMRLSPLVTRMSYAYYDAQNDSWDIVDDPDSDLKKIPYALEITFNDQGNEAQRWVYLPIPKQVPTKGKLKEKPAPKNTPALSPSSMNTETPLP